MNQIIISLFVSYLIIENFNLSSFIRFNLRKEKLSKFKLFRCLPCFTWWTALTIGYFCNFENFIINSMAAFIVAVIIDKIRLK